MLEKDTIPRDVVSALTSPIWVPVKAFMLPFKFAYRATKAATTTRDRKVTGRLYWIEEPGNAERHRAWLTRSE